MTHVSTLQYIYLHASLWQVQYLHEGLLHHEEYPARVFYQSDLSRYRVEYHQNGLMHREGGPALIVYQGNRIVSWKYYMNGKSLTPGIIETS